MVVLEKNNSLGCRNCGSKMFYIRIKTNELVCRTCGVIEKLENLWCYRKVREEK